MRQFRATVETMAQPPQGTMRAIFQAIRRSASAQAWSQGVRLAREGAVSGESSDDSEVVLRVAVPGRAVAPAVVLYLEDEDWECDCANSESTCAHIAAAVIAVTQAGDEGEELSSAGVHRGKVCYRFCRENGGLVLDRYIALDGGKEHALDSTLAALLSGRVAGPAVGPEQADLNIDRILGLRARQPLPPDRLKNVLTALVDHEHVELDHTRVAVSRDEVLPRAVVEDFAGGARVVIAKDPRVTEVVAFGVALCGDALHPALHPLGALDLTGGKLEYLPRVYEFSRGQLGELRNEFLPDLIRRIEVDVRARAFPKIAGDMPPRIDIELEQTGQRIDVLPTLVYGQDPPNARIDRHRLVHLRGAIPLRDKPAEKRLIHQLRDALNLVPGQRARFEGRDAVEFLTRLDAYRGNEPGARRPAPRAGEVRSLVPHIAIDGNRVDVYFELAGEGESERIPAANVLSAWRDGFGIVLTRGSEQASLPVDWLQRYGHIVADLLSARNQRGQVARYALPDLARLCGELDQPPPPGMLELEALVRGFDAVPEAALPRDLQAELRPYQHIGVNWLCFLRDAELGAVLADDMGLGKTLQALCAITGRTLIVCPTSVIHNWASEIARFRPSLTVAIYHGPRRNLTADTDIVLTTYAILRLDIEKLAAVAWGTVILDEAQAIKNPESQVARAAYRLQAGFRATLSGTPVENRLDELWSQFHFVIPGLLGGRKEFKARYAEPIGRGEGDAAERLRTRIRPFLLRRLKREVAPELPPRTDSIMYCELDERERELYEAIRTATHRDVLAKLAQGGSVLAAFEALLRLRQASCHGGLIPGQSFDSSSKIATLAAALELAAADEHKALVFSQWTSLLDLIEPHLEMIGIPWVRLDGSTRDRGGAVASFQDPGGPPVMLISLKAGGFGLNLTAADHVFLCDPWWNPAAEDQAADRAHRIGQERPVNVYRLVSKDTVEERVLALQAKKRALAEAALSESSRAASLTRDDLLALLA